MADFPNQDPCWPDRSHFELLIAKGKFKGCRRCQRWKSDRSGQCGKPSTNPYEFCDDHGAAAAKANKKLKSRRDFQDRLAEEAGEDGIRTVNELGISALAKLVQAGDVVAIKYWFDQQFGGPTSTQITEIVDKDLYVLFVSITAEIFGADEAKFESWLSRLEEGLRQGSALMKQS